MVGVTGAAIGAAVAESNGLKHPFTLCLNVYSPAVVTKILGVVCPVLQTKDPV